MERGGKEGIRGAVEGAGVRVGFRVYLYSHKRRTTSVGLEVMTSETIGRK